MAYVIKSITTSTINYLTVDGAKSATVQGRFDADTARRVVKKLEKHNNFIITSVDLMSHTYRMDLSDFMDMAKPTETFNDATRIVKRDAYETTVQAMVSTDEGLQTFELSFEGKLKDTEIRTAIRKEFGTNNFMVLETHEHATSYAVELADFIGNADVVA